MTSRLGTAWSGLSGELRRFFLGAALLGAARAIPQALLALYLDRLGQDKSTIGAVLASEGWGQVLVSLPAALLLARMRTPPVLAAAALVVGLAYGALPWLPGPLAMRAAALVSGTAWILHAVAVAPFLFRHAPIAQRAFLYALSEAVHTLAGILGALAASAAVRLLAEALGERAALAVAISAAGLPCLLAAWIYSGLDDEAGTHAPHRRGARRAPLAPLLWTERGFVARFAVPRIVLGLGAGLSIPFLGLYFQDRFELAPAAVGQLQAAAQLFMSAGFLLAPAVEARLGAVGGMCALQAASMPFFVCLAFAGSLPVAAVAFLMRAGLMNAATPIYKSFLMREARPELREVLNGIDSLAWGLSWVAGPHLGGAILDASRDSYATLMLVTVGLYVVSVAATAWLLGPRWRRAPQAAAPPGQAPGQLPAGEPEPR